MASQHDLFRVALISFPRVLFSDPRSMVQMVAMTGVVRKARSRVANCRHWGLADYGGCRLIIFSCIAPLCLDMLGAQFPDRGTLPFQRLSRYELPMYIQSDESQFFLCLANAFTVPTSSKK